MTASTSPSTAAGSRGVRRMAGGGNGGRWAKVGVVLLLLLLWEVAARVVASPIILPGPLATGERLARLALESGFYRAVGATVLRGLLGFSISLGAAVLLGVAAGVSRLVRTSLAPVLTVLRATPVMSVILLALIWFRTSWVPVFVAFLMVFPILCGNVTEGVRNVDRRLVHMAGVYGVRGMRIVREVYLPATVPYLVAGMSSAVGITWKVIVAAEVLSQPFHAIGSGLELAKYRLDTAAVFAWTIVAIVLTAWSERAVAWAERRVPWRRQVDAD